MMLRYADGDEDGFGDPEQEMSACDAPDDWVEDNTDCDDGCAACYPGAEEICDGENNDCVDNDTVDETFDCELGSTGIACITSCGSMGVGDCSSMCAAPEGESCIVPAEVCNGVDDDCDGVVDNGLGAASSLMTIAGGSVTPTLAPERLEVVTGASGQAIVAFRDSGTRMLYLQRVGAAGEALGTRVMVTTASAPAWFDLVDVGSDVLVVMSRGAYLEYGRYDKATLATVRSPLRFADIGDFVTEIRAASDGTRLVVVINDGGALRSISLNLSFATVGSWQNPLPLGFYMGQPYSFDIAAAPGGYVLVYGGNVRSGGLANQINVGRLNDQGAPLPGGSRTLQVGILLPGSESYEDVVVEAAGGIFGVSYIRSRSSSNTTAVGDRSTDFFTFSVAPDSSLTPALTRSPVVLSDCAPYPNTRTQQYASYETRSGSLTYFTGREAFALTCYAASVSGSSGVMYRRYLHLLGLSDATRDELFYPSPAPGGAAGAAFRSLRTTAGRVATVGDGLLMVWGGRTGTKVIESQGFGCL
jgi:hypothetical protein